MPKFAIVVIDPKKTRAFHVSRYADALQRQQPRAPRAKLEQDAEALFAEPLLGDVHTEMDSECPDGGVNCSNCGDPQFAASCKAAGHCADCGTKHGIAPTLVLTAHGFTLEPR